MAREIMSPGVSQFVVDGYDAVYDALPDSELFSQLWRQHAYGEDFPEEYAHIGFLTVPEAQRVRKSLRIQSGGLLVDIACGAGGPGLWMAAQSGASLVGIDPSAAGLVRARQRARDVGLADNSRFALGTFEATTVPDYEANAVMSIDALQYAPNKRAAFAECFRLMRAGGRLSIIAFEVDPTKVAGIEALGDDPIPNYQPHLEAAGFVVEIYEETTGWHERVHEAFSAIVDAGDALASEMGDQAASAAVAEAVVTLQLWPYPRRVLMAARKPERSAE